MPLKLLHWWIHIILCMQFCISMPIQDYHLLAGIIWTCNGSYFITSIIVCSGIHPQGFNATLTEPVDTQGRRVDQFKEMELKLHPDLKEPLKKLCNDPNTIVIILSGSDRNVLDEVFWFHLQSIFFFFFFWKRVRKWN